MRLSRKAARELGIPIPPLPSMEERQTQKAKWNGNRPGRKKVQPCRDIVFDKLCEAHGIPVPVSEYQFCEGRKWAWDHCWPEADLALECQGGLFIQGRHTQGAALLREYEKLREGAILGWRVLFCTPQDVESGEVFGWIKRALEEE